MLVVTSKGSDHLFVMEEANINETSRHKETKRFSLFLDTGEYEFYGGLPGHKDAGEKL